MIKRVLAGVAAVVMMSGVASAQLYAPAPPPVPVVPPAPAPAPVPDATTSTTTTTTVAPTPEGTEVTRKDVYQEGVTGSTETHTKTESSPWGGTTTTRSTTTTSPQ